MAGYQNNSAIQDEASSASHASSSRFTTSMNAISSGSQPRLQHQPLSMADALARTGHDQILALDQLLAERNKLCLEVNKLSTENMRLWNMMKRIRRENEELKANNGNGILRNSPLSNGPSTVTSSSMNAIPPSVSSSTIAGMTMDPIIAGMNDFNTNHNNSNNVNNESIPTSSTAPALTNFDYAQGTLKNSASGPSSMRNESNKSSLDDSPAPSGTEHSNLGNNSSEPRGSFASNEMIQDPNSTSNNTTRGGLTMPSTMQQSELGTGMNLSNNPDSNLAAHQVSSAIPPSLQHQSIMQQRAAAQAQRLAQIQSQSGDDGARPSSAGSHEFDAVDGSSIAASEDIRNSMRFSGESGAKGGQYIRAFPPSPLAIGSPTQTDRSGRGWNNDSPRNSFSPRLDSAMLQYIALTVSGSNLRPSDRGKEIVSFYIAVDIKAPQGKVPQYSSWRVEKTFADILNLDARIKQKNGKAIAKRMASIPLPDQNLFKDHAPSKVDKRKSILETYLRSLLSIPLPDKGDLCTFFCTDAVQPKIRDPDALTKEGFLTKKGQNLGRWVTRWYELSETSLDHYEWRNGLHLGSINIRGAQIGRQQKSAASDTDENSYRHAFLILETKPAAAANGEQKQIIRHVLCAESDEERDEWVDVLVRAIGEADNRDENQNGGIDPANPYMSPIMPNSATRSAFAQNSVDTSEAPLSPTGPRDEATNETSSSTSANYRTPSGGISINPSRQPKDQNLFAMPTSPTTMASPQSSISRSKSDMTGLQPSQDDRGMRMRHANLAAMTTSSASPPPPNVAAIQSQQSGTTVNHRNQAVVPNSPVRPPPRSTSQDVGGNNAGGNNAGIVTSSSSVGHNGAYDNGTFRTSSPGITGGGGTGMSSEERQSISSSGPRMSKDRTRPSISAPMNGTPIPTGYKFGGKDEIAEGSSNKGGVSSTNTAMTASGNPSGANETKRRFWHRFAGGGGGDKSAAQRKVFGVPLAESIAVSNVTEGLELPSVVYRCIEYLEHHNAASEEGIYRLSGSSAVIKSLKDRFNLQGDVNLLSPSEPFYDPHAIAGLLKQYLRELPSSVLTRELHLDFMRVNDLVDRRERVNELGSLVSMLPLANYSLLRTLCSHLIKIIERSDVNKMTMRNVGIVFSPTLGIPAGVFALFLTEFDWVFYTDAKGEPAPRTIDEDILPPDEYELGLASKNEASTMQTSTTKRNQTGSEDHVRRLANNISRNNRNSLSYNESEADKLLGGPQARNRLSSYVEEAPENTSNGMEDPNYTVQQDYYDAEMEAKNYEGTHQSNTGHEIPPNFGPDSTEGQNEYSNVRLPRMEGEITNVVPPRTTNFPMSPPQRSGRT